MEVTQALDSCSTSSLAWALPSTEVGSKEMPRCHPTRLRKPALQALGGYFHLVKTPANIYIYIYIPSSDKFLLKPTRGEQK